MSKLEQFKKKRSEVIFKLNKIERVTSGTIKERKQCYQLLLDEVESWLVNNLKHAEFDSVSRYSALLKVDIINESQKLMNAASGKNPYGKSEECMGISALPYKHSKES